MEVIEKLILWILLSVIAHQSSAQQQQQQPGTVPYHLNQPQIRTEDLRAIDHYVSTGLPLFRSTNGFVLHGNRPVIVKIKDPNKPIRDGIEQPNPSYYRDLPSVIPQGYEGIASTSFLLGNPIPPKYFPSSAGPVVMFAQLASPSSSNIQQQQTLNSGNEGQQAYANRPSPIVMMMLQQRSNLPEQYQQQQQQQSAQQSIRVENKLNANTIPAQRNINSGLTTNSVVEQTSQFESTLPNELRNPFYSNEMLATMLAHESLPAPGEQVVEQWDTHKIREGRIRDLLSGAGLI